MQIPAETWITPKAEVRDSLIQGYGLVAVEAIEQGEKVLVWGGDYTDSDGARRAEAAGKLVMQWDENLYSIEDRGEDRGYYLNHSCDPNVWMQNAFTLTARRQIPAGDEITADYALWEADEDYVAKWVCECASSFCRVKVKGTDWRLPELQKRYGEHFSPLINKRIQKQQDNLQQE